jgi:hypothetical protein
MHREESAEEFANVLLSDPLNSFAGPKPSPGPCANITQTQPQAFAGTNTPKRVVAAWRIGRLFSLQNQT